MPDQPPDPPRFPPPYRPAVWHWREPAPIRSVLLDGARSWGLDNPLEIARVFGSWKEMVGEQVAARCEPASLGRGVLKVWASSGAWANELKYLAPEVIRRVNGGLGGPVVRELKVSLRPPVGSGRSRGGRGPSRGVTESPDGGPEPAATRRPGPALPSAPVDALKVQAMVAGIADEKLAEATKRAVLAAKTRPRGAGGTR